MGGATSNQFEVVSGANLRLDLIDAPTSSMISNRRVKKKKEIEPKVDQRQPPTSPPPPKTRANGSKKNLSVAIPRDSFLPEISEISVTVHSARKLRDTDRGDRSDPYCLVTLYEGGPTTRIVSQHATSTVWNNYISRTAPVWDEIILFVSPNPTNTVRVEVFDQCTCTGPRVFSDQPDPDDSLGFVQFTVHSLPRGSNTPRKDSVRSNTPRGVPLTPGTPVTPLPHALQSIDALQKGQGNIFLSFETSMTSPAAPMSTPTLPPTSPRSLRSPVAAPKVVLRQEIRTLSTFEQNRFCSGVLEMMKNGSYCRLAGYFGYPNYYSTQHRGQENYLLWHRAYLCEFERELIKADLYLGNNGSIGLPYYDWTDLNVQQQSFPTVLSTFFSTVPTELKKHLQGTQLDQLEYQLNASSTLTQHLQNAKLSTKVDTALLQTEHWRCVIALENVDQDVHVAFGFPMSTEIYAAYHPIFFLHHCNMDRILTQYFKMEVDSRSEFASRQRSLHEQASEQGPKEVNRFEQPLKPFRHPMRPDETIYPRDTFDNKELGYMYDELVRPPMKSRSNYKSTYCLFKNMQMSKSFMLHVFVTNTQDSFVLPFNEDDGTLKGSGSKKGGGGGGGGGSERKKSFFNDTQSNTTVEEDEENEKLFSNRINYAGCGAIFAGSKARTTCGRRSNINVLIDITTAMQRTQLTRDTMQLHTICMDEFGKWSTFEQLRNSTDQHNMALPMVVGSMFEHYDMVLKNEPSKLLFGVQKSIAAANAKPTTTSKSDVAALQTYLVHHGYYGDSGCAVDGLFGIETELAVQKFQTFCGMTTHFGIVGRETKLELVRPRFDHEPDVFETAKAEDEAGAGATSVPKTGRMKKYIVVVGSSPGYLDREDVMVDVKKAFQCWELAVGNVFFDVVDRRSTNLNLTVPPTTGSAATASVRIDLSWKDHSVGLNSAVDELLRYDSPGSTLARVSYNQYIQLSATELWSVQGIPSKLQSFSMYHVLLHEIGHCCFNLAHSSCCLDVMSPFYTTCKATLTSNDIQRGKDSSTSMM